MPNIFLMRIQALSSQLGPDFFLPEDISNALNSYSGGDDTNTSQTHLAPNICFAPTIDKSLSYSTAMCQRRMATFGLEASTYCTVS